MRCSRLAAPPRRWLRHCRLATSLSGAVRNRLADQVAFQVQRTVSEAAFEVTNGHSGGSPESRADVSRRVDLPTVFSLHKADPFKLVESDIHSASSIMGELMTSSSKVSKIVEHIIESKGKRMRPTLNLLLARALQSEAEEAAFLSDPPSPHNHAALNERDSTGSTSSLPRSPSGLVEGISPDHPVNTFNYASKYQRQQRLAEITELIHTGSLLHDDVIDEADTRRGKPSAMKVFGNKQSILAGDFCLARASTSLACLEHPLVIRLMSDSLAYLVTGEIMSVDVDALSPTSITEALAQYNSKNFHKTASIIANSCKSVAILGECSDEEIDIAYEYGRNLGLCFQIVDDILDVTMSSEQIGKPSMSDMKQGLITAPVLFAAQEHPELITIMQRKFSEPDDPELVLRTIMDSNGVEKARQMATEYAALAVDRILRLRPSEARSALINLVNIVLYRKK